MTRRQHLDSFVARIWLEREANGDPIWRGHIRHVQSERDAYFQNLGEMSDFLERVSRVPGPGANGRPPRDGPVSEPEAASAGKRKN